MKRNIFFLVFGVFIILSTSCDGMLDNIQSYLDEGETIYVGKVDSLEAFPGKNRVQLKGYYLYGVTQKKCIIKWTSVDDQEMNLELDVVREQPEDPFDVIIDNLDEGQYEFSVTTYDAKGNCSIESVIESYVYGELYESNLTNRKIDSKNISGSSIEINWRPVNDALEVELYYTDAEGNEQMRIIPVSETLTIIEDCADEGTIRWRTVYLPEENAIDRFYSTYSEESYEIPKVIHELDKTKFAELVLDNDLRMNNWGRTMSRMWDGNHDYYDDMDINHAYGYDDFPVWFTFDLGVKAQLSSYIFWQRGFNSVENKDYAYNSANFKKWEVWGCADEPSKDGSWDGWEKLLDCEIVKPSGSSLGTNTEEDIQAAIDGHEFVFPENSKTVRYIRFKLLETFDGTKSGYVKEVTFYGI